VFGTLEGTDSPDRSRPPATTRVVLKASATARPETLVHELTHAVAFSWADGYPQVPEWVAEGLAQYVEVAEVDAVRPAVVRSARAGFADAIRFPDSFDWSSEDELLEDYAVAWAGISALVSARGQRRAIGCVRTMYAASDAAAGLTECGVPSATAHFRASKTWLARQGQG
jgi:hypothetical protein